MKILKESNVLSPGEYKTMLNAIEKGYLYGVSEEDSPYTFSFMTDAGTYICKLVSKIQEDGTIDNIQPW